MLFDQQICTVHILSFSLLLESLGGFLWFLGPVLDLQLASIGVAVYQVLTRL